MKRRGNNPIFTAIVLILIGILMFVLNFSDIRGAFSKVVDLDNNLDKDIKVGTFVNVGVDAVVDMYATMEHKTNGIKTSEDYYYAIWLDDESFIGLVVKKKEGAKLDAICEQFWDYMNYDTDTLPDKVYYTGAIAKMNNEEQKYYDELLADVGATDEGYPIRYYHIDTTTTKGSAIMFLVISIGLVAAGVIVLVVMLGGTKAPKAAPAPAYTPVNNNDPFANMQNMYGNQNQGGYAGPTGPDQYQNPGAYTDPNQYQNPGAYSDPNQYYANNNDPNNWG